MALSSLFALCACDLTSDLGETATTAADSGGMVDTGHPGDGETDAGTDTGMAETGGSDDESDSGESGTGTEVIECDESPDYVRLKTFTDEVASQVIEQLGNNEANTFVGLGNCDLTIGDAAPGEDGPTVELTLDCVVDGTHGQQSLDQQALALTLELETNIEPASLFSAFGNSVNIRIDVFQAFNTYMWLVLEQPVPESAGFPLLIANAAYSLEPEPEHTADLLKGPWFGGPTIATTAATCGPQELTCQTVPVALEAGWLEGETVVVHAGEHASFGSPFEGIGYDVYPRGLWAPGEAVACEDYPSNYGDFVVIATQQ